MNIFGNDGFRCEFGKHFMTKDFIDKFSNSLCDVLDREKSILIARDTRASGIEIEKWIKNIMIENGRSSYLFLQPANLLQALETVLKFWLHENRPDATNE